MYYSYKNIDFSFSSTYIWRSKKTNMKKKQLKISDLTVTSFVTSLDGNIIKGGSVTHTTEAIDVNIGITNPVMACDPRDTFIATNCACSGMYPSMNMPCPTLDIKC